MKNSAAAKEVRDTGRTTEDLHDKILAFLTGELARKEGYQCTGVDLLYAPGEGYRDEPIRKWVRADDSELFDLPDVERLVVMILKIAEDEVDAKPIGRHRFVVRTHQHFGGRATHSFALSPPYVGGSGKDSDEAADLDPGKRKRLLARVAGDVASGIVSAPSKSTSTAEAIATVAVDVAEEILRRIGL